METKANGGLNNAAKKLRALADRKAALDERIKRLEGQLSAKSRKEDTRMKVLIGAAFLADVSKHSELIEVVRMTLARAIVNEKDRDFLRMKGWLR